MHPETSCPRVTIESTHSEDTPLLGLPCGIEPKWLSDYAEDARPPSPSRALVLRKPDSHDAAKCYANLIYAHGLHLCGATPSLKVSSHNLCLLFRVRCAQKHTLRCVYQVKDLQGFFAFVLSRMACGWSEGKSSA